MCLHVCILYLEHRHFILNISHWQNPIFLSFALVISYYFCCKSKHVVTRAIYNYLLFAYAHYVVEA